MATGYTHPVKDGKVTEFSEFAIRCARAMGALITMRDASPDAEVPDEVKPSNNYEIWMNDAISELEVVQSWDNETASAGADAAFKTDMQHYRDAVLERNITHDRYAAMLQEVELWDPPTPEHAGLKKFMREQLVSSIEFDCDKFHLSPPVRLSGEEYRQAKIEALTKNIERLSIQVIEEQDRAAGRTKWIQDLKDSLGIEVKSS